MNKKLILLLCILCGALTNLHSQTNAIELKTEYDDQNKLTIKAHKSLPGSYYLEIDFKEISNSSGFNSSLYRKVIKFSGDVLSITPTNRDSRPVVRYSYRYWRGNPEPNPDTTFVYRLPYSESIVREVRSLYLIGGSYSAHNNINWHNMEFIMQQNDTIYAARTGIVIDIKQTDSDEDTSHSSGRVTYRKSVNSILVEHEDGTYANYSVLDSIFVSVGNRIHPDGPIGIAGSYDGENYQLRLSLYYLQIAPPRSTNPQTTFNYHYFYPVFATTTGDTKLTMREHYQPAITMELITREMTRREARKYQAR